LKMVANPLTFHRFFVTALLSIHSLSAFTSTSRSSLFFHCGGAVDTKDIQWKNICMREKFLHVLRWCTHTQTHGKRQNQNIGSEELERALLYLRALE